MSARRPPVTPDGLAFRRAKIAFDTTYRPRFPERSRDDTPRDFRSIAYSNVSK